MTLFGSIVRKILNEDNNKNGIIKYEDIKNDYVNGPMYVYHMTSIKNLKGAILKTGWESYYNAVNSYGPGIYTCVKPSFDPSARVLVAGYGSKPNPGRDIARQEIYAKDNSGKAGANKAIILLCKTLKPHPLRSFLIFDEGLAKTIYRNHWRIMDQLKLILGNEFNKEMNQNHNLRQLASYTKSANRFLKNHDKHDVQALDGYNELYYRGTGAIIADRACDSVIVNKKIRGLIFHGPGDGFVAIFRDYNALKPVGVSDDLGHTFKPIETEYEFDSYKANNIDIRSTLGLDRFYNPTTNMAKYGYRYNDNIPFDYLDDTFYGDYAVVGKKMNGDMKWNYIYKPLIKQTDNYTELLVSKNIWFDSVAKNEWIGNKTIVKKDNELYFIKNNNGVFLLLDKDENVIGDLNTLTDDDLINYKNTQQQNNQLADDGDEDDDKLILDF